MNESFHAVILRFGIAILIFCYYSIDLELPGISQGLYNNL